MVDPRNLRVPLAMYNGARIKPKVRVVTAASAAMAFACFRKPPPSLARCVVRIPNAAAWSPEHATQPTRTRTAAPAGLSDTATSAKPARGTHHPADRATSDVSTGTQAPPDAPGQASRRSPATPPPTALPTPAPVPDVNDSIATRCPERSANADASSASLDPWPASPPTAADPTVNPADSTPECGAAPSPTRPVEAGDTPADTRARRCAGACPETARAGTAPTSSDTTTTGATNRSYPVMTAHHATAHQPESRPPPREAAQVADSCRILLGEVVRPCGTPHPSRIPRETSSPKPGRCRRRALLKSRLHSPALALRRAGRGSPQTAIADVGMGPRQELTNCYIASHIVANSKPWRHQTTPAERR